MDRRQKLIIGYVITVVWTVSFLADIILKSYDPSPFVHLAFMAVVGYAFGSDLIKKNGDKNGQ